MAWDRRVLLLAAALCAFFLHDIPIARWLGFPVRMMSASVHEMGHALAVVAGGGKVLKIDLWTNGKGWTNPEGGIPLLTASGGLLGSILFGCVLLAAAQVGRYHRATLAFLAMYFAAFTFHSGNVVALATGAGMLGVVVLLWRMTPASETARYFLLDFAALSCCLGTVGDTWRMTKLTMSGASACRVFDVAQMAQLTGVPRVLWAAGWTLVSLAAVWAGLKAAWRLAEDARKPA